MRERVSEMKVRKKNRKKERAFFKIWREREEEEVQICDVLQKCPV